MSRRHERPLYSVEIGSSALTVAKLLRVLFPDAATELDMTYGSGRFWSPKHPVAVEVTGLDINAGRARDVVGDFTALDFPDSSFDVALFDPPYLSDVSKSNPGIVGRRFGSYSSTADVQAAVEAGCSSAWRVARLGIIVEFASHIHESKHVDMQGWVRAAVPSPIYGQVEQVRPVKLTDPKRTDQLSVWSNSATFLVFRHGDQRHIRRARPARRTA